MKNSKSKNKNQLFHKNKINIVKQNKKLIKKKMLLIP